MGIRVGGGKGFINVGGGEGLHLPGRLSGPPPKKPLEPIQNPFPEKEEFRLGVYQLIEEFDDYLTCKGYDPNAERATRYTRGAHKTIKVAKPALLQRTPWDGQTVNLIVDGVETPVTFQYTGIGVRTATATIGDEEVSEIQRITMDYIPGDVIVAVEVRKSAAVDGMDVYAPGGSGQKGLTWLDLNMSGRSWATDEET